MAHGLKIGLYCSDVSGAFDKVDADRLILKCEALGIHPKITRLLGSWLRRRRAHVVVEGCTSPELFMQNMVYQGTVWGPPLWNIYYRDVKLAIAANGFIDIVYADDLNAFKTFPNSINDDTMHEEMQQCQRELHS